MSNVGVLNLVNCNVTFFVLKYAFHLIDLLGSGVMFSGENPATFAHAWERRHRHQ